MSTYQELCVMSREQLLEQPCHCCVCPVCDGTGNIRVNARGQYIRHYDDNYELEPCYQCIGGVDETCNRCDLLEENAVQAALGIVREALAHTPKPTQEEK